MRENLEDDSWLVLGMSRGQVIFFNIFNLEILHSRYDVVSSEVLLVKEVTKYGIYLIFESKNILTLCEFKEDKCHIYH